MLQNLTRVRFAACIVEIRSIEDRNENTYLKMVPRLTRSLPTVVDFGLPSPSRGPSPSVSPHIGGSPHEICENAQH